MATMASPLPFSQQMIAAGAIARFANDSSSHHNIRPTQMRVPVGAGVRYAIGNRTRLLHPPRQVLRKLNVQANYYCRAA